MKAAYKNFVIPAKAGISSSTFHKGEIEIPACAGMTILFVLFVGAILTLVIPSPAHARLSCEREWSRVISLAQRSNMCHEDSDCVAVKLTDCTRGCQMLPVYKWMQERVQIAADGYIRQCGSGTACQVSCLRVLSGHCNRGRCSLEFRDWKYLSKQR